MDLRAARLRRLGIVVLAALAALLAWNPWSSEGVAPPVTEPHAKPPSAVDEPAAAEAAAVAARTQIAEDLPAPSPHVDADLGHPFAFTLDVRLFDRFALPVADAMVFLAPPMCGFALWPERTNPRGRVRLAWHGREPGMAVEIAVMAWGVLQPMRLVHVQADLPGTIAIVVEAKEQSVEVQERARLRDEDDVRHAVARVQELRRHPELIRRIDQLDILCGRTQLLFRGFDCTDCHDESKVAPYSTLARAGEMTPGLHPESSFRDLRGRMLSSEEREARRKALIESRGESNDRRSRRPRRAARVYGVVQRDDGERAADVPVAWRGPDGAVLQRTTTDPGGRYVLDQVGPGAIELVAGGGPDGQASAVVAAVRGDRTEWNCRLEPSSIVSGTAVGDQGEPLVGWRVEFEGAGWTSLATTGQDGAFRFTGVPGQGQCLLRPKNAEGDLPVIFGQAALVDASPIRLALDRASPARASVRVHVALPPGHTRDRIDARLYQLETGRVVPMPPFGFEDAFEVKGVPTGSYRIQLGAPALGWVTTGVLAVDGRGLWDIGRLFLPAPGRVRLRLATGATSPLLGQHAFYRRTAAADVMVDYLQDDDGNVMLPTGEHLLLWRDAEGLRSLAFRVESAAMVELAISPR